MIELTQGNLLKADAEALVNTVNCVGYMGKGIALQFKKAYPANFAEYQRACASGEVQIGAMLVHETVDLWNPKYIINFPTKRHWRSKSRLEDIEAGLEALVREVEKRQIESIAIPALGCGLGGLDWADVRPRIEAAFAHLPQVRVLLFEPAGTPDASTMPIGTKRPKMTAARALLIKLMEQYRQLGYQLTLLEVQKLAYFLQEMGQPLQLRYEKGHYGPYAHNLNKVLELLEGHLIRGYGDNQKPDIKISLLPGASETADTYLERNLPSKERLERVRALIEGFETPYGMELLASVHWLAVHENVQDLSAEVLTQQLQGWTSRKKALFQPAHVKVAWERLQEEGVIS